MQSESSESRPSQIGSKRFGWSAIVGAAVLGAVAALLMSVVVGYFLETSRKIYPGSDFPVEWAGREQLGASYESSLSREEFVQASRLSSMKLAYEMWCLEHDLTPKSDVGLAMSTRRETE